MGQLYPNANKFLWEMYIDIYNQYSELIKDDEGKTESWEEYKQELIKATSFDMKKCDEDISNLLEIGYSWNEIIMLYEQELK